MKTARDDGDPDDEAWFDALAGRPAHGPAAGEAARLREALSRLPQPALAPPTEAQVVDAARARGLLRRRGWCPGCAERWQRWRRAPAAWAGALATAAAVGWLAVGLQTQAPPEAGPVLRAPADGVWLRAEADPLAARERLAGRLQALGVPVRRYERLGRHGLDADLPRPLPEALAALLREERLAAADDGSLRVEFTPR